MITLIHTLIKVISMKDRYLKPFVEVILMSDEDIITGSNNGGDMQTSEDELPVMPF